MIGGAFWNTSLLATSGSHEPPQCEANLIISAAAAHSAVPFYLQPTLGGGDIHNENWLRSYTNYRFRAPNMVAYGVTYERRLIDPFGFFIFAQWGKVGLDVGELDFDRLKRSIGFGIALRLGGRAVAEFSFAWGGGEGTQTYSTGNTNNAIGFGARAAGTVGLRGVFLEEGLGQSSRTPKTAIAG